MKQFFSLAFAAVALAQPPTTLQVDVNNFVLYNYDTFDMNQFGTNGSATNIMMKTYNFHVAIGDITTVSGTPAKGTAFVRDHAHVRLDSEPDSWYASHGGHFA